MRVDLFLSESIHLSDRHLARVCDVRRLAELPNPQAVYKPSIIVAGAAELAAYSPEILAPFRALGVRVIVTAGLVGEPLPPFASDDLHAALPQLGAREEEQILAAFIQNAIDLLTLQNDSLRTTRDLSELIRIGVLLSSEKDTDKLLELILTKAREVTGADAGSLYLLEEEGKKRRLIFKLAQNDSVALNVKSTPMLLNEQSVAGYTVLSGETVVIDDAYRIPPERPFSHGRWMDERLGYRSVTMLAVPLKNLKGEVIGCLQLINRKRQPAIRLIDNLTTLSEVIPFDEHAVEIVSSLASLAAVTLEKNRLYESIQTLFEGFVLASVKAIESRDPTTSGHSERVAKLTLGLGEIVNRVDAGPLAHIRFTPAQLRELRYAALLHDFGKVGVREPVLVKAKKLYPGETEVLRTRALQVSLAIKAETWKRRFQTLLEKGPEVFKSDYAAALDTLESTQLERLREDLALIWEANEPRVLPEDGQEKLWEVADRIYATFEGEPFRLIDARMARILSIPRGSLTEEERIEIESHVTHTHTFLSMIPWTKELRQVPEIAFMHHEKLNTHGYPRGLAAQELPAQARMMTICDIFDALTASDRPYKRAVPTPKALDILRFEAREGQLDPNLLDLFIASKVYECVLAPDEEQKAKT